MNRKKRILVAEDSETIRSMVKEILEGAGYEVFTASDGKSALAFMDEKKPDLLILDMVMPGMTGLAVLDILKAKGCATPVLVITGHEDMVEAIAHHNIAGLLLKPFDEKRLIMHVKAICDFKDASESLDKSIEQIWREESRSIDKVPETPPPATKEVPKKPVVLVVDDDENIRQLMTTILESRGFEVITASDGQMGLNLAHQHKPNAILLDLMLPKLEGFQVCRLLKFDNNYRQIPIIIITARVHPDDEELAMASGANGFIRKPFEANALVDKLNEAIKKTVKSI